VPAIGLVKIYGLVRAGPLKAALAIVKENIKNMKKQTPAPKKSVIKKGDPPAKKRTMEIKPTDPKPVYRTMEMKPTDGKPTTWGGKVSTQLKPKKEVISMSDPRHPEYNSAFNREARKRAAEKKTKSSASNTGSDKGYGQRRIDSMNQPVKEMSPKKPQMISYKTKKK
jgi:hypothetical protein